MMVTTLNYQQHGRTENNAPTLVLVHGLFGSSDNLSVIRRHFEKDFRIINIDLPDHGLSSWTSAFSFEHYAQCVTKTLQHLEILSASFVAHSLGAKVVMYLAYLAPTLVKDLVCLDMAPVTYEPRHHNVITGLTSLSLSHISSRKEAQQKLSEHVKDTGTQAFLLKSLYQDVSTWKWRFNLDILVRDYAVLSAWPLSGRLVYANKVLFIKGRHSDYITQAHQSDILEQFPQAKAKIVEAGHWLHAEKPHIVNTLITKHLLGK